MSQMPRAYALKRLLEHGRMTRRELVECTGWPAGAVRSAISRCLSAGTVRMVRRQVPGRGAEFEAVTP